MYLTLQNPITRMQNALKIGWSAILLISLWLGICLSAWAQPQYNFTAVSGTYVPLVGGTVMPTTSTFTPTVNADDIVSAALPIGFTFVYDGIAYTQFKASSNGWLTFNTTSTIGSSFAGNNLASLDQEIRPLLAPFWDDLGGDDVATANATYLTTGTAGNRILTVEWLNWQWRYNNNFATISFQIKLYEATGVVEYIYRQEPAASNVTATNGASIGLTKATTGSGQYFSLNNASAAPTISSTVSTNTIDTKPATGQIYRWAPNFAPVRALTPSDNAVGVALDANLSVGFAYPATAPTLGTGTIEIRKTIGDALVESFVLPSTRVTLVGNNVVIDPVNLLDCNTEYYVIVPNGAIVSGAFAGITTTTAWSFTTTNACSTLSPTDNATGVATSSNLTVTFPFGTAALGTGTIELRKTTGGTVVESFTLPSPRVTLVGNVLTIDPTSVLDCNTEYYITVSNGAVTGTGFTGITTATDWSFTTSSPVGSPTNIVTLLDENFGTATGSTPPTGWVNNTIGGAAADVWRFDNPEPRAAAGFTAPFAIFDSDNICSTPDENVALESPAFNASTTGLTYTLSFNHHFRVFLGNSYFVEVFNGTTWTTVLTGSSSVGSLATAANESINITTASGGNAAAKVRFRWTGDCSWYWIVDDVKITSSTTELPLTATFTPLDNATGVSPNSNLVLDFPYPVSAGTGNITVRRAATGAILETIPVGDARVTISGGTVTINPTINLPGNTPIAVQFPTGAFRSCNNLNVAGITDNTTWNFTTVDCSSLTINAGADQTVNPNTTVNLNAVAAGTVAGATYSWTPTTGLSDATIANPTIANLTATTSYTVTVTNPNGCQASDVVVLTSGCDALIVNAGADRDVASNSDVVFAGTVTGATGALTYAWTPAAGLSDATVLNPTFTGFTVPATFTLTVTDAGTGCVKSDNIVIGIAASGGGGGNAPTVVAPALRITSVNSTSLRLNWVGGNAENYAIFRSNSSFGNNYTRLGQVAGTLSTYLDSMLMPNTQYFYYVQAIRGSATANSNIVSDFTYPSAPVVTSFQNACVGTGAQLTVRGSSGVYNVYSSATGGTAIANGDSTGVITTPTFSDSVTYYISAVGLRYESTPRVAVRVITRALPTSVLLGAGLQESCTDSLMIRAQSVEGATYTWYSSNSILATTSTPMYTVNRSGVYSVLVNKDGCVARSNTIRVRVNRTSPAQIVGTSTRQFCEGGVLNAVQTDSATYEWQRNSTVVGTGSSLEVTQSGNYTVTVTSILGCVLTSERVSVTIISVPELDLTSSSPDFCEGSEGVELNVNAVNGASYEWLRGGRAIRTTSTPSLQTNVGGEYRVRVILNGTCSRTSDALSITRNAAPRASARVYGDSVKVVYVGNAEIESIVWTKDSVAFSATTQAFAPTESGLYRATVTYTTGCEVVSSGVNYTKRPEAPVVTGDENVEALGFMLFPNPTSSKVNLSFGAAFRGEITLTLSDAIGRTIQVVKVKANESASLDLSQVANGNYMLTIASKDKVVTRKIIRE